MKIVLPEKVTYIIDTLTQHGFEAYAVGGCVRWGGFPWTGTSRHQQNRNR